MNALENAIKIAGGQSALARKITEWFESNGLPQKVIKQQHVWKWIKHPSGIPTAPPVYRRPIQEITGGKITIKDLSHDIYGSNGLIKKDINSEEVA